MLSIKIVFWISLFILIYSYLGYGLFLFVYLNVVKLFSKKNGASQDIDNFQPEVTLVVATYNEEVILKKKIENTFQINYPANKLKIIFVADGSSDNTVNIIREYPNIELFYKSEREGKSAAINRVMPFVTSPFTIFCDANTFLNAECVNEIIKHYKNPEIGAVAGEKKVVDNTLSKSVAGSGEGLYWKYESILKRLDASFYSVVGAAGELFSIRTHLFEPVEKNILLDDFIISMRIGMKGYRVMYEPKAFAAESPSSSVKDEQKRKIRIAAGGFQSIFLLKDLLNIFKYGKLSFQYISHRVLRWLVCPILLPIILFTNLFIVISTNNYVYHIALLLQSIFYLFAFTGWVFSSKGVRVKLLYIPYYFLFMNVAMYQGFIKFVYNKQSVLWEKAKRLE
jgi:cellulose synthase/poly-beta-1,6-N-acetylglucosamine synthase-like glycosyltransferase